MYRNCIYVENFANILLRIETLTSLGCLYKLSDCQTATRSSHSPVAHLADLHDAADTIRYENIIEKRV